MLAERTFTTAPGPVVLSATAGELEGVPQSKSHIKYNFPKVFMNPAGELEPGSGSAAGAQGENGRYGAGATSFTLRPQLIGIGAISLCTMPFEVLADFALAMKAKHPGAVLVTAAGGYEGYMPLQHEFARGGCA